MKDGGYIVPNVVADDLARRSLIATDGIVAAILARRPVPPPLTRRRRIRLAFWEYRWRIYTAIAVLRGRHDCGDL